MGDFSLKLPHRVAASPHQLDHSSIPHGRGRAFLRWTIHNTTALVHPGPSPRLHTPVNRVESSCTRVEVESSELSEPAIEQPPVGRDIEVDWTCVAFTPTY